MWWIVVASTLKLFINLLENYDKKKKNHKNRIVYNNLNYWKQYLVITKKEKYLKWIKNFLKDWRFIFTLKLWKCYIKCFKWKKYYFKIMVNIW